LQAEGIRLIFDMKIVDTEWQAKRSFWEAEKSIDQDL
jgi:hypothetical protein